MFLSFFFFFFFGGGGGGGWGSVKSFSKTEHRQVWQDFPYRRMAENGFAPPPLGNFADISYLVENRKPSLLRDVCTLCSGALVCKSL